MILFFKTGSGNIIAVGTVSDLSEKDIEKLTWLFGEAALLKKKKIEGTFVGPRKEMITPWSTNAVEITQNMGVTGIKRIEELLISESPHPEYDPMLQEVYLNPGQNIFTIDRQPEKVLSVNNIKHFNEKEGLALSKEEIEYLEDLSKSIGRPLTDSEVFGFSQVNSEHCRHKIFNGIFIIDGEERDSTLFQLIKNTTHYNRNKVVSAYKDNCAFLQGPVAEQFAPANPGQAGFLRYQEL